MEPTLRAPCIALVLVLAGCGRLGFDPVADGPDARPCNPVGHDEDQDGVDDACDVCPQLASDATDSDHDGVGDACDLHPAEPDTRVVFQPFHDLGPFTVSGNGITTDGESVSIPGVGDSLGLVLVGDPPRGSYELGGIATDIGATNARQYSIQTHNSSGAGSYYCELYDPADGSGFFFSLTYTYDDVSHAMADQLVFTGELQPGAFRMVLDNTRPDVGCFLEYQGGSYELRGTIPGDLAVDQLSIAFNNVNVSVHYYLQLSTP